MLANALFSLFATRDVATGGFVGGSACRGKLQDQREGAPGAGHVRLHEQQCEPVVADQSDAIA